MALATNPTALQARILAYRDHVFGIWSLGARGTGKSISLALDVVDYARQYGKDAVALIAREQWAALIELQGTIYEMCQVAFPGTTRNKGEAVIECGNGAKIYFTNVVDADSYAKRQGLSIGFLGLDEVGNWPPTAYQLGQKLRSNLRAKPGQRVRMHATGNPLGRSHHRIYKDVVTRSAPWRPFLEKDTGLLMVWADSAMGNGVNPHIDEAAYRKQVEAATATDPALRLAWINGTWSPLGGNMFAQFDPGAHVLDCPSNAFLGYTKTIMGADFGMSAPSVGLVGTLLYENRGGLQRGSILVRDEFATVADWNDLSIGTGMPPADLARMFRALGQPFGTRSIVTDDSRGISSPDETVVKIFNENGLWAWKPRKKDRVGGWATINQMLLNAKRGEGPGLFISSRCRYLLDTISEAPRDPLRREDIDLKYNCDHGIDALNYLVRELRMGEVTAANGNNNGNRGRVIGAW